MQARTAVSSSSGTANVLLPGALASLFPSHGTACRNEASSHHCWHFPSLLSDTVKPSQCHTNHHGSECTPNTRSGLLVSPLKKTGGVFSAASAQTPNSRHNAQPSPGSRAETAVCKRRDLQLTGSNETNLLQNQKADI